MGNILDTDHFQKQIETGEQYVERAIKGITPDIVRSMNAGEVYEHNDTHHLYSYTTDGIELEEGESYVVLKDNITDEEIAVLLLHKDKISYQMLI